ncbi:MAG: adenosylcobinamide-GDP ribazoletransferase [Alteromonadaceae bacterium]|jgi:adenosylcobinamide-GDP ribazoletransferase
MLRLKNLRHQLNLFYLALSFFSRIPVPKSSYYSPELLNQSGRYFSLVGIFLALILCLFYTLLSPYFSADVVVALIIIASLLLTGAFHEDGLTDMADGIGGGMTIEKRLLIMKDSRIGTYGAVTLCMALLLKWLTLTELAQHSLFISALVIGYGLSRAIAGSLIFDMLYVSDSDTSKSKPLANKQSTNELMLLLFFGCLPLLLLPFFYGVAILISLFIFRTLFKRWLNVRIGGYTGDCLGACQQISELIIYLALIALSAQNPTTIQPLVIN